MVYNRSEVVERALAANGGANTPGMCQAWTRSIIGAHAVGDFDGDGDADAVDGWKSEPDSAKHYDRNPPAGVPVAWSGGGSGFGHRAVSVGNGRIASTDAGGRGIIAIQSIDWFERNWGMNYLGWSDTMSGIPIPNGVKVKHSYLDVVSWNCRIDNPVDNVRSAITVMSDKFSPDMFYIYEGSHLFDALDGLGYQVFQLKPKKRRKGLTPNNGNVIALVRNGVLVVKSRTFSMSREWLGPLMGRKQAPRVYRTIKVMKRKTVWKTIGAHFPFGTKPRRESVRWIRKMIIETVLKRPVIAFGDYNFNKMHVTNNVGNKVGAKVAGKRIDLAVYKNCELIKEVELGAYGSDHSARYYRFKR